VNASAATIELLHQTLLGDAWHNASVGVVVFDDDRHVISANDAYCDLVGYARDEIHEVVEALADGHSTRGTLRRKDGELVRVEWETVGTRVSGLPYVIGIVRPA
jgi:PAS domain-containing protein